MRKENCEEEEHNEFQKDPLGGRSSLSSPQQNSPTQAHCVKASNISNPRHRRHGISVRHPVQQYLPQHEIQKTGLSEQTSSSANNDMLKSPL
jgi:hypothetical protein